jgi:hypothetical protein
MAPISKDPDDYMWGAGERRSPGALPAQEGRIARGSALLGRSWTFLRANPRLMVLPTLSALSTTIAALILFAPTLVWATEQGVPLKLALFAATLVSILPFTFITTFFNVGFLSMVLEVRGGREATVGQGLAAARGRLRPIVAWSLLASGVGALLSALEHVPGAEWAGKLISALGGLAWGLATYFVVPVLTIHGTGARDSVRRSARVFRDRWGEQVTGDITIGVVFLLLATPGILVGVGGSAALGSNPTTGIVLIAIAVVLVAPLLVASSSLTQLFQLDLYRYAVDHDASGLFAADQLEAALKPRKRRWRRSRGQG